LLSSVQSCPKSTGQTGLKGLIEASSIAIVLSKGEKVIGFSCRSEKTRKESGGMMFLLFFSLCRKLVHRTQI
jgi:hypothetical protein